MAINVQLKAKDGKLFTVKIGEDFVEKKDFNKYLKLVKSLEEREFDSINKVWKAPLTTENLFRLDTWLLKAERLELEKHI